MVILKKNGKEKRRNTVPNGEACFSISDGTFDGICHVFVEEISHFSWMGDVVHVRWQGDRNIPLKDILENAKKTFSLPLEKRKSAKGVQNCFSVRSVFDRFDLDIVENEKDVDGRKGV